MKKTTRTPYESPQADILSLRLDRMLLAGSETGESFNNPVDYDLIGSDWNWIL